VARLAIDSAHEALLSNSRGPETLRDVVSSLGSRAARAVTSEEAAMLGDLVVVAVPVKAYPLLPAAALAGKPAVVRHAVRLGRRREGQARRQRRHPGGC
jgi:hypothetical protein